MNATGEGSMTQPATLLSAGSGTTAIELPLFCSMERPATKAPTGIAASKPADKLELTNALAGEIQDASARLETAEPQEILRWATQRFAPRFTMATAFGPEGMVLI